MGCEAVKGYWATLQASTCGIRLTITAADDDKDDAKDDDGDDNDDSAHHENCPPQVPVRLLSDPAGQLLGQVAALLLGHLRHQGVRRKGASREGVQ